MYPLLQDKILSRWKKPGYYVAFVLTVEGEKIGSVSFDIYDFLKKGKDNYIILDTWNFFIAEEWQKKNLGKYFLKRILPIVKNYYFQKYGFTVAQVIIETNTAPEFYEKIVPHLGYKYEKVNMVLAGELVSYFFINM